MSASRELQSLKKSGLEWNSQSAPSCTPSPEAAILMVDSCFHGRALLIPSPQLSKQPEHSPGPLRGKRFDFLLLLFKSRFLHLWSILAPPAKCDCLDRPLRCSLRLPWGWCKQLIWTWPLKIFPGWLMLNGPQAAFLWPWPLGHTALRVGVSPQAPKGPLPGQRWNYRVHPDLRPTPGCNQSLLYCH